MSYVSVPNVDAAISSSKKRGGEVVWGPINVEDIGRMATVVDPRGAAFSMMRSFKGDPDFAPPQPGEFCWEQLATHDLPKAKDFYAEVVEWTAAPFDGELEVFGIRGLGRQAATLVPAKPPLTAGWMTLVAVEDLDQACERAEQLGGKVLGEPIAVKDLGAYAVIQDPQGARLGLFQ
jgi:predicted enzyme related to lactoylglutathione lyase